MNLQFHCTFRHSAHDLQYLMQIFMWLVVLIRILAWLAVKNTAFYKLHTTARLPHWLHTFTWVRHMIKYGIQKCALMSNWVYPFMNIEVPLEKSKMLYCLRCKLLWYFQTFFYYSQSGKYKKWIHALYHFGGFKVSVFWIVNIMMGICQICIIAIYGLHDSCTVYSMVFFPKT